MTYGGQLPNLSLNYIFNALSIGVQYKPSRFSKLILVFWENLCKILVKYTLRIEVRPWKVLLLQHFQSKRFQDKIMESAHFPHVDVPTIAQN